ncbi:MAG: nitroreductase family protein [Desulfovibrio sp.]|nr:nitroreductase family protein [Desulfovibrio sp.]
MPENSFAVNKETCVQCGECAADCVCEIIRMDGYPFIETRDLDKCIRCGHCQAICPTESITLNGINNAELEKASAPSAVGIIETVIKNRRSLRRFYQEPVDKNLLVRAIEIAAWAPAARNIRDIGFVIFNGREKVERLMSACADIMEKRGIIPDVAAAIRDGKDRLFRGAPCVLAIYAADRPFAASDCASTLAAIELSLPSLGLASCWAGYFTAICGVETPAEINLPKGKKIFGGLMIGRPKVRYRRIPARPTPPIAWI